MGDVKKGCASDSDIPYFLCLVVRLGVLADLQAVKPEPMEVEPRTVRSQDGMIKNYMC